jgi:hypothetical protein
VPSLVKIDLTVLEKNDEILQEPTNIWAFNLSELKTNERKNIINEKNLLLTRFSV